MIFHYDKRMLGEMESSRGERSRVRSIKKITRMKLARLNSIKINRFK